MNSIRIPACSLLAFCMLTAAGVAQPNNTGKGKQISISTNGGYAMVSDDGGNTWRVVDNTMAEQLRDDLGRQLQGITTGAMIGRTTVRLDRSSAIATVTFQAPSAGLVTLTLHDIQGMEVIRQEMELTEDGEQITALDVSQLKTGTYILRINSSNVMIGGGKIVISR